MSSRSARIGGDAAARLLGEASAYALDTSIFIYNREANLSYVDLSPSNCRCRAAFVRTMATAIRSGASAFLINDLGIARIDELKLEYWTNCADTPLFGQPARYPAQHGR